jgi:hypothetical protein
MIFVTEEMATFVKTPMMVVGAMCGCDGKGLLSYCRSMSAAESFLRDAHDDYNPLVQRVLEKIREAEDRSETLDDFSHVSCEEVQEHLDYIADLLAGHPDGAGYMQFLYDLAAHVANSTHKGLFGKMSKLTAEENAFLNTLKARMDVRAIA